MIGEILRVSGTALFVGLAWQAYITCFLDKPNTDGVFIRPNLSKSEKPSHPNTDKFTPNQYKDSPHL